MEDPRTRGFPLLGLLGLLQGKGGCGTPSCDVTQNNHRQTQAGLGVTVCLLWGAFRGVRTPQVRWVLPGSGGMWAEGPAGCARRGREQVSPASEVDDTPSEQPASLEHPVCILFGASHWPGASHSLGHPICILLRASHWSWASHPPQGIPSTFTLEHPAGLEHPIHILLGASC